MAAHCGAKTRSGTPCKGKAMPNGRCRMHGGKTPPTNQNAAKPGSLYSKFLSTEEQELFDTIELGKIDDELRLMRIRLTRALAQEKDKGDKPELDSVTMRQGGGLATVPKEATSKRRDYVGIIDRIAGRIESLERTRIELIKAGAEGGGDTPPDSKSFVYNVVDGRKAADADAD